jgi:hypothetical protein
MWLSHLSKFIFKTPISKDAAVTVHHFSGCRAILAAWPVLASLTTAFAEHQRDGFASTAKLKPGFTLVAETDP